MTNKEKLLTIQQELATAIQPGGEHARRHAQLRRLRETGELRE